MMVTITKPMAKLRNASSSGKISRNEGNQLKYKKIDVIQSRCVYPKIIYNPNIESIFTYKICQKHEPLPFDLLWFHVQILFEEYVQNWNYPLLLLVFQTYQEQNRCISFEFSVFPNWNANLNTSKCIAQGSFIGF